MLRNLVVLFILPAHQLVVNLQSLYNVFIDTAIDCRHMSKKFHDGTHRRRCRNVYVEIVVAGIGREYTVLPIVVFNAATITLFSENCCVFGKRYVNILHPGFL